MGWKHEETKELIWEAIEAIKEGRNEDALVTLERAGRPKWHGSARAAKKYAIAKAEQRARATLVIASTLAEGAT